MSSATDPAERRPDADRLPAEVLAATYAELLTQPSFLRQVQPQVRGGSLDAAELGDRISVRRPDGTALVELTAGGPTEEEALGLAGELTDALLAHVRQLARQRTLQLEEELRRRLEDVDRALAALPAEGAGAAGAAERLESLRGEREALASRLADVAVDGIEQAAALAPAAPPAPLEEDVPPEAVRNVVGGALVGLVAGLGVASLRRRRPGVAVPPAPEPATEPDSEPEPEAEREQLAVTLVEPAPGAAASLRVPLRAEAHGAERIHFLLSDGGPDWREVAVAGGDGAAEWDASGTAPGRYWLSALAVSEDGATAASEPRPLRIDAPAG